MGASETVQLQCSANSSLQATVSAERQENTDLTYGSADLSSTSVTTVLTMSSAGVVESILLTNDDGSADVKVTTAWTNSSGTVQSNLSYEMVIPAASSVELLEQPLAMPSGHKIRATANVANRCEVIVAAKYAS